ncbi:polysaccharide biosynthesis C-terminal domain-containing protein [Beduini massiliensis]|uniref:polysaccharide biosynthesis C-terminal domain-containing protein n=1 Tax=Beduini massiliensis TaxID=1585974 RepID=UPI00059A88B7|nr:polysaccharide biosynthesis C-terminal domain-containing protein [Beduini massiliensis]
MSESRTEKAIINSLLSLLSMISILLITFISRKLFLECLGNEILGLNSLFQNIIAMLSVTDAGLSTATIFFLYKPIEEKNYKEIVILINFCKKMYSFLGLIVAIIGGILMLNINYLTNTSINNSKVQLYLFLYISSTIATYFFSYKKSILYANQKNGVISIVHMICKISFEVIQMIVIFFTKNYVYYLLLLILFNFSENFICNIYVNKHYPYLKEKSNITLNKKTEKKLMLKLRDIAIQNISTFAISSSDNLIISSFISTSIVGVYSNYNLIIQTLKSFFSSFFSAFTTSFGNLSVSASIEKCHDVYKKSLFFAYAFSSVTAILYFCLIQNFISLWIGKFYLLNSKIPLLMIILYFLQNMNIPAISVQNALGYHNYDKYLMILQGILNIIVSILFVNLFGITGVILGTIISNIIPTIAKNFLLYKYYFIDFNWKKFWIDYFKYLILFFINFTLTYTFINYMNFSNHLFSFIIKMVCCSLLSLIIFITLSFNDSNFKFYRNILFKRFKKEVQDE